MVQMLSQQGEFVDLCAGPHLMSTKGIKAFKLLSSSGAYWRGNENNKMLTRIYGTAYTKKADLEERLKYLEEIKLCDHSKILHHFFFILHFSSSYSIFAFSDT